MLRRGLSELSRLETLILEGYTNLTLRLGKHLPASLKRFSLMDSHLQSKHLVPLHGARGWRRRRSGSSGQDEPVSPPTNHPPPLQARLAWRC